MNVKNRYQRTDTLGKEARKLVARPRARMNLVSCAGPSNILNMGTRTPYFDQPK